MNVAFNRGPLGRHAVPLATLLVLAFASLGGCAKDRTTNSADQSPGVVSTAVGASIRLVPLDANRFEVRVRYAPPAGGGKVRSQYHLDPPLEGAGGWSELTDGATALTLPSGGGRRWTLSLRLLDGVGLELASERYEFTDTNVLPSTLILSPRPNNQQPVPTPNAFTMRWTGNDPDGVRSQRPTAYVSRLARSDEIDPANPNGITPARITEFFTADRATNPGSWTAHGAVDTSRTLTDLTFSVIHYLAVLAQDEAGEEEAQFLLTSNVLFFRPTASFVGPRITLFSPLFQRSKSVPSLDPTPLVTISLRPQDPFTLNWSATPPVGRVMDGFRWAVDIADIADETPRSGPDDVSHWSEWSTTETAATVGPFPLDENGGGTHLVYVMARDDLGGQSLATMQIDVFDHEPGADLLIIDDLYGTVTELAAGQPPGGLVRITGPWPMEAEQDSFHVAVGGFPDRLRASYGIPGAMSLPGLFSGYAADTLDYRFWPQDGIPSPFKYRAVAWYTDNLSASRNGSKFGSLNPSTAIRQINSVNRVNTLAQYVQQGGKLWIFGEGMTPAIANGYFSRLGGFATIPPIPYTSGDDPRANVLFPGNFLYDFCHLRSELNQAGTTNTTLTLAQQLHGAIPYLPEFRGPASQADRSHDPRIGAGAERTALRWSGLPRLTIAGYRGATANPADRSIPLTWVITQPLSILEGGEPVLDTLYLNQARTYDPTGALFPATDGKPNAVHYHGANHGEVVWFGFPMYFFESEQGREVVRVTMRVFGIEPQPGAGRTGVGTAHDAALVSGDPGDGGEPIRRR